MRSVARLAMVPPIDISTTCASFEVSLRSEMGSFGISGMMAGPFGVSGAAGFATVGAAGLATAEVAGFGAGFGGACAAATLTKARDETIRVSFMYLTSCNLLLNTT